MNVLRYNSFIQAFIATNQEITSVELENRLLKLNSNDYIVEIWNKGNDKHAMKSETRKCTYCKKLGQIAEKC